MFKRFGNGLKGLWEDLSEGSRELIGMLFISFTIAFGIFLTITVFILFPITFFIALGIAFGYGVHKVWKRGGQSDV